MTEARFTFAIPDLHGRLDLLDAALDAITARAPDGGTLVCLGDYVDRGPDSARVLARLAAGPAAGWIWVCLKGNHEAMMASAMRDHTRLEWWVGNGGEATLESYQGQRELLQSHLVWIDDLPLVHADRHRVYVHGGVDPDVPLDAQPAKTLLWKRYPLDVDEGLGDRHVVHGHDPVVDGPLMLQHRTDLDTYAWQTGRLVVGVFEDARAGGPIDVLEVTGASAVIA